MIIQLDNPLFRNLAFPERAEFPSGTEANHSLHGLIMTAYYIYLDIVKGIGAAAMKDDTTSAGPPIKTLYVEYPLSGIAGVDKRICMSHNYNRGMSKISILSGTKDVVKEKHPVVSPSNELCQRGEMLLLPVFFQPDIPLKEAMERAGEERSTESYENLCNAVLALVSAHTVVKIPINGLVTSIDNDKIFDTAGATSVTSGAFRHFTGVEALEVKICLSEVTQYRKDWGYTEEQKKDIPVNPDYLDIPDTVWKILHAIQRGRRKFLLLGDSGAGKSTIVPILAQLLGMVKFTFTCSDGTDESSLISSYGISNGKKYQRVPSYTSLMNDPASAYMEMTGEYIEDISGDEVLKVLSEQSGSGYKLVDSSIVKACRIPSIIEIAEPFSISRPGVMTALNSLWDDKQTLTTVDGEVIQCNPDTVFILTSNPSYKASRGLDEATISRMNKVFFLDLPSAKKMAERAMAYAKLPPAKKDLVLRMASVVKDINEWIRVNAIRGAVCSQRELNDWVDDLNVYDDPYATLEENILNKISLSKDIREEVKVSIIDQKLAS